MSTGWSWYVIALTAFNLLGVAWLLWWTAKRRPGDPRPEQTSHYWDEDITEYNKPLPRWWIQGFYIAIAFGIGYIAWYGGLGKYAGISGWSSQQEHAREKAASDANLAETFRPYDGQPIDRLAANPEALRLGRSIFANTCATCHGSSAQGATGYPNLADDIWHWGGDPERILQTVLDGREGVMAPLGTVLTGMGGDVAITQAAAYVRALRSDDIEATLRGDYMAARGKKYFDGLCMACHGIDGKGNQDLGAPDLTARSNTLYPNTLDSIRTTIIDGRHGVMPAHRDLLGETRSRLVAAYVWSLSNTPATAQSGAPPERQ